MLTASAIKERARALGFDLCGIAPATGMPELSRIHDWIARGQHGEMTYLAKSADVRADVTRFLPGARSVIVTASNYYTGPDPVPAPPASVARYARGRDYHLELQERLDALLAWMQEATDRPFDAAPFVDKHWVQERVVAAYAGLGWIGKHSLLINRDVGSWLLLGGLVTTLPLAPDAMQSDQCGACTLCIDACPTGAILDARDVDARKCISYLTIEKGGALTDAGVEAKEVDGVWVGSCAPGLFANQEHLAAFATEIDPAGLRFKSMTRCEDACASGSVALYDALYALEAGRAKVALVVGVERNGERILNPAADFRITAGDLLWIVGQRAKVQAL